MKDEPLEEALKEEKERERNSAPSLFERLFPDQRIAEQMSHVPEPILPPPVPADIGQPGHIPGRAVTSKARVVAQKVHWSKPSQILRHDMRNQPLQTSVLVLRNASKNLVEEDFRRLVPKGQHMDSWTMEQGDILRVVPMRDLFTLAHKGVYYLLFASVLSAFTYQGYATRIHRMVAAHTPSSLLSPMPPPPGYLIDGLDAHAAMDSFTLVPPTQSLDLRQLKPPLAPLVEEIVRDGGYAALHNRKDRMPFEARITFDGPQLSLRSLRHAIVESAKSRALGWSGGDSTAPQLSQWKPPGDLLDRRIHHEGSEGAGEVDDGGALNDRQIARRTPAPVYIAGFPTQRALQSFTAYWHRRRVELGGGQASENHDYESPPIANVEALW